MTVDVHGTVVVAVAVFCTVAAEDAGSEFAPFVAVAAMAAALVANSLAAARKTKKHLAFFQNQ